jgi:hypothetical protein
MRQFQIASAFLLQAKFSGIRNMRDHNRAICILSTIWKGGYWPLFRIGKVSGFQLSGEAVRNGC